MFDLGGVLIDWDPRHLYRKLFDDAEMERFLSEVCTPAWNLRQDEGRPWAEAISSLASRHPEQRELIAAYRDRWEETLAGPIGGTVALLDEAQLARRRVGARQWTSPPKSAPARRPKRTARYHPRVRP